MRYILELSAFAAMSGRIVVDADSPEEAKRIGKRLLETDEYDADFELIEGNRPALGSAEIDEVRAAEEADELGGKLTELRDILMGTQRLRQRAHDAGAEVITLHLERALHETRAAILGTGRPAEADSNGDNVVMLKPK